MSSGVSQLLFTTRLDQSLIEGLGGLVAKGNANNYGQCRNNFQVLVKQHCGMYTDQGVLACDTGVKQVGSFDHEKEDALQLAG